MPTVQDYVDRIEAKIAFFRQRAKRLIWWGRFIGGPVWLTVIAIGALVLLTAWMNGAYRAPVIGRPIARILLWFVQNYPDAWSFLTWFGPTMNNSQAVGSSGYIIWAASWLLIVVGLKWLGFKAVEKGKTLRDRAAKDENTLEFQEPGWRTMETMAQQMENLQNMQNVVIGNITGSTVTVSPNIQQQQRQMHTILVRGEDDKPWWTKPTGLIVIGVAIDLIAKFLGGK